MTEDYKPSQLMLDWEKALRVPGKEQTTGALCKQDEQGNKSYCCLGVLEETAGNVAVRQNLPMGMQTGIMEFRGETAFGETGMPNSTLIDVLFDRLASTDENRLSADVYLGVDEWHQKVSAAELNDDHGWTFVQIADQIRKVYIEGNGNFWDYEIEALVRDRPEDGDCDCC